MNEPFKSGYIAILGAPNVGKSTFLNSILGEKISIVSSKPQTTRERVLGIHNLPNAQLLFLDTPGLHTPHKLLNSKMVEEAKAAIVEADVIFYLFDAASKISGIDREFLQEIERIRKPYFIILNKVDSVPKLQLLPKVEQLTKDFHPKEFFFVSSTKKDGIENVLKNTLEFLPEGPAYFPTDDLTNRDMRYLTSERIREKLFELTRQEIPYSIAVVIDEYKEEPKIDRISATIYVEKDSQKLIVVGKRGELLKAVGTEARLELEELIGKKIFLTLFVKVVDDWTKNERILRDLGFH